MKLKNFVSDRLWFNNASLVQLLGLCPVLAMTNNAINAVGLGITTTIVLILTNTIISIFQNWIPKDIRIPIYMMIISSVVTSIEMILHAYFFTLYQTLGIFIPLIVTNCIILGRADFIAYKNSIYISFLDGLFIGIGSTISMFFLGAIREIVGNGTLFFGANKIFFMLNDSSFFTFFDKNSTILLAILPPGGFIILGMVIALKNTIQTYYNRSILISSKKCSCILK